MDLGRGLGGALRQLANLVGHHREAPAHVAGACGFDGGIEGQQVGLIGDAFDDVDDGADFIAVPGQLRDGLPGFPDDGGKTLDGRAGVPGHVASASGQQVGFLGGVRRALDMAGDLQGGRGHLVDGGGDLLGFDALAIKAS
ncbi:hypothetical protein D3C85_572020 [compost metagenome]